MDRLLETQPWFGRQGVEEKVGQEEEGVKEGAEEVVVVVVVEEEEEEDALEETLTNKVSTMLRVGAGAMRDEATITRTLVQSLLGNQAWRLRRPRVILREIERHKKLTRAA